MQTILVPTDFSTEAENAFDVALQIAEKTGARLELFHVVEFPGQLAGAYGYGEYISSIQELLEMQKQEATEKLSQWGNQAKEKGLSIITRTDIGTPNELIVQKSKEDTTFIIMGTKGSSGLEELFIGSQAEKVVRRAACPVLVINKECKHFKIETVAYTSTFEEIESDHLSKIIDLLELFNATIHLARINTPYEFQSSKEVIKHMKAFADRHKLKNFTCTQYNHENFEQGLQQFIEEIHADMVVIGTHGRTGLSHFFLGSITESLVNHISTPILTFKL